MNDYLTKIFTCITVFLTGIYGGSTFGYSQPPKKTAFIGLEKTRDAYAQALYRDCLEHYEDEEGPLAPYLKQCVFNSRLFSKVEVTETAEQFVFTVEEKWSLIPIPFVQAGSGDNQSAGLFLLDTNFLGLGKIFAVGGSYGSNGSTYFLSYQDRSVFFSKWNFGLSLSRSATDVFLYEGEEKRDAFHEEVTGVQPSFGYRFGKFVPSIIFSHQKKQFQSVEEFEQYTEPDDYQSNKAGIRASYNSSDYKLYYQKGVRADANYLQDINRSDEQKRNKSATAKIDLGIPSFSNQAILLQLSAGISGG